MKHLIHYSTLYDRVRPFLLYGVALIFFIINATYVNYPDEFVNMLGGKAILAGGLPYRDFFDHHMPFAWYLSALLLIPSGEDYVLFRTLWALLQWGMLLGVGIYIYKTKPSLLRWHSLFALVYPLVSMYYWTHLFLADSLAFTLLTAIVWILLVESFAVPKPRKFSIIATSFLTFLLVFSSMTYAMMAGVLYLWQYYLMTRYKLRGVALLTLWIVGPYILYGLFLAATNSLKEFYISNIVYNTKLYISIPNYTRGVHFNPVKFAGTLTYNFYQDYVPLLSTIKAFDLYNPMASLFALSTFLLLLYAWWRNKIVGFIYFLLLTFSAPRSSFQVINETNYQVAGFVALGLVACFFLLWARKKIETTDGAVDLGVRIATIVVAIMTLAMSFFMLKYTYERWFLRYTQAMPSINNRSDTASFINEITKPGDYYWVGPYEPHHQFFVTTARLPGPYVSLLPQFREDDYFKEGFIRQFEKTKPAVIIFRHESSIFNTPADIFGKFFVEWMKGKYTKISNLNVEVKKSPSTFTLRDELYIRNDAQERLLEALRRNGYIQ